MFTHFVITIGSISVAITGIVALIVWAWKFSRKVGHVLDDVMGEPGHGGGDPRPGWGQRLGNIETQQQRTDSGQLHIIDQLDHLTERVGKVESEFQPNHGSSLRDRVDKIEGKLDKGSNT